jgi:hypothetical protein
MRIFTVFITSWVVFFCIFSTCHAKEPQSPQVAIVVKLYKHFAYEAVLDSPNDGPGFINSPRPVLLSYLTPELTDLLLKDRECVDRTEEMCKLGFAPLWDSQDPAGVTVNISPTASKEKVMVQLRYVSAPRTLIYHLMLTTAGWRIQNISYENDRTSLAKILGANN